jgi:1-deoxy-D-xylulose-5-phosphate synthase
MSDYKLLSKIDSPDDLNNLSISELSLLSDELAEFMDNIIQKHGGHYSSPLGVVDLSVALHHVYNSPKDKIIWDIGHQSYPHKILTGRRDSFHTLRQKDGISGFLKRSESPHDIIGAGHSSTSISSALGVAHARDMAGTDDKVVAIIGDGGMTGGLAYEGLNNLGYHKTQLTIILNDNSMSISPSVGALSHYLTRVVTNPTYNKVRNELWNLTGKIPDSFSKFVRKSLRKTEEGIKGFFTPGIFFEELGLRYIGPIPGHDMDELVRTLNAVKDFPNPTLVHVYSDKGKRSKKAEKEPVKYYSLSGNKNKAKVKVNSAPSYSTVFGNTITKLAETDSKIYCITAAMEIGTGMSNFVKKYPDRYIDVGIAEGHAVTYSCGIATGGYKPIIPFYSTFIQRAYDNIFHDVLLQELPVIFCMDRAGVVGPDGPTHHGVYDISLLRNLPNIIITAPKDGNELKNLIATGLTLKKKSMSIRYPKDTSYNYDENTSPEILEIGSWEELEIGENVVILAVGSMVGVVKENYKGICNQLKFKPSVINARFIKPLDCNLLNKISKSYDLIITMEEGALNGGFGSAVLEYYSDNNLDNRVIRMGIPDRFVEHASRQELLEELGLSSNGLIQVIKANLKNE